MNKNLYKVPLKMTGDRLLFCVITWIFSFSLSVFIIMIAGGSRGVNVGLYYSFISAIPYIALIYYESYDVGSHERIQKTASMKNAVLYCLIWQIPCLIMFFLYLLSAVTSINGSLISTLMGSLFLTPFIGPRGASPSFSSNVIQYLSFMGIEWVLFLAGYYLGSKDVVFIKTKKGNAKGIFKK